MTSPTPREVLIEAVLDECRVVLKLGTDADSQLLAALVDVKEAAEAHSSAWQAMCEALEERNEIRREADNGQFISESYKASLHVAVREANAVEHRTADALAAALTRLEAMSDE